MHHICYEARFRGSGSRGPARHDYLECPVRHRGRGDEERAARARRLLRAELELAGILQEPLPNVQRLAVDVSPLPDTSLAEPREQQPEPVGDSTCPCVDSAAVAERPEQTLTAMQLLRTWITLRRLRASRALHRSFVPNPVADETRCSRTYGHSWMSSGDSFALQPQSVLPVCCSVREPPTLTPARAATADRDRSSPGIQWA